MPRHFLDIDALDSATLKTIMGEAHAMKNAYLNGGLPKPGPASGAILAMLFEKSSTRTRVSFDVAMRQLGGETIVLNHNDMQLGRGGVPIRRGLCRACQCHDAATAHQRRRPPIRQRDFINGLTPHASPLVFADVMTFEEEGQYRRDAPPPAGDADNNVASLIHAAARFGFTLRIGRRRLGLNRRCSPGRGLKRGHRRHA
jgi:ornithine carbamoyltransferase